MYTKFRQHLASDHLPTRILTGAAALLVVFFGLTVISHYLLPEGLLRGRNPLQNWDESPNTPTLAAQIFLFNMISVVVIALASLFGSKKPSEKGYLSTGWHVIFAFVALNAITLGTWSFSVQREAPPLLERIVGKFDLVHRAAMWEMAGQLLITAALAHIAIVRTNGKETTTRHLREVRLTRAEKAAVGTGLALMLLGAVIEAIAING